MQEDVDNIVAAMDKVAETMDLTIAARPREDGDTEPASKQILIRATEVEHERWKRAAEAQNISMSQMVRDHINKHVTDVLDCSHPMEFRQKYPWSEFCRKCDLRLR